MNLVPVLATKFILFILEIEKEDVDDEERRRKDVRKNNDFKNQTQLIGTKNN